ncbi:MAG: polysaccharide deacetylase family protein, partial [Oscillospiraceae bacterium]|nr:polysaccharide deacetylase family protein [Oscillospiraceae bacterium]
MKIFVLTRKKIMIILSTFSTAILAILLFFNGNFLFAIKKNKKLPIYKIGTEEKFVSLSFDAAWGNEQTENLLNTLKKFDVKTTFFLTGLWVDKYPESVKAIYEAGHDVENHSNSLPHMPKLDSEKMRDEIEKCNEKIKN